MNQAQNSWVKCFNYFNKFEFLKGIRAKNPRLQIILPVITFWIQKLFKFAKALLLHQTFEFVLAFENGSISIDWYQKPTTSNKSDVQLPLPTKNNQKEAADLVYGFIYSSINCFSGGPRMTDMLRIFRLKKKLKKMDE